MSSQTNILSREVTMKVKLQLAALAASLVFAQPAFAAELKVLTAGAMKEVVLSVVPAFEKETGHKVTVANDTVGALVRRIEGGEAFDVLIASPGAIKDLGGKGKTKA